MSNHEFCEDCWANDFHLGRPCDPVRLAKTQEAKKRQEHRFNLCFEKATKALQNARIPFTVNSTWRGQLFVNVYDFENREEKP